MSVRRLAPAEIQPPSFAFTAENENWASGQIAKYPDGRQASAVIPLLWRAQEQAGGWLPQKAIESVADRLGMPYIRVLEVATFYTMFALEPVGRYWIQLCGTVPCDVCGARELKGMLEARLGPMGHVDPTGTFSWLEVECLGACCNAPMVQINQDYYEDLTPESLGTLLDDLAAGRPVRKGSQVGRVSSEPREAVQTLRDETLFDGSRVGAWRRRFEEAAVEPAGTAASVEAASTDQRAANEPKMAKPDAGRAIERSVSDAPAQRVAKGEKPLKPADRAAQSDPSRSMVAGPGVGPEPRPAPEGSRSYAATPSPEGLAALPTKAPQVPRKPLGADPTDQGPPGPGSDSGEPVPAPGAPDGKP